MILKKIKNLYFTLKYLKLIQIYQKFFLKLKKILKLLPVKIKNINNSIDLPTLLTSEKNAVLTEILIFNEKINLGKIIWHKNEFPKLWNYHLHYFDYLPNLKKTTGMKMINDWIEKNSPGISPGWEPYPISLRAVNWIKFVSKHNIHDKKIINSLSLQGKWLFCRREYHLLANHLFKNIVALLYLSFLFKNERWENWAIKELKKQLEEQLTEEGYHFEFSPTYHAIFVKDLLDIYNLIKYNEKQIYINLMQKLSIKIQQGLHWLDYFTRNEKYLQINDVNYEGCPLPYQLINYASNLGIKQDISFNNKNSKYYPKLESKNLEIMLYCAPISPDYNPAHSHADMLSILLWDDNNPILIDTGNYDYEESEERKYARSTFAHNAIVIDNKNQCELWKVFRIAKRGKIFNKNINKQYMECSYDFCQKRKIIHTRKIEKNKQGFVIKDLLNGKGYHTFKMHFHFSPNVDIKRIGERIFLVNNNIEFRFPNQQLTVIKTFYFPKMFVKERKQTILACGKFMNNINLKTKIKKK